MGGGRGEREEGWERKEGRGREEERKRGEGRQEGQEGKREKGERERERPGKMVQSVKVTAPRSDNLRSVWDLYGRRRKPIPSGCPLTSTCYGNALLSQINTFNF